MSRFFLTTAIDYVNSRPHLGTAYEKITADVIARYKRLCGFETRFLMGNDEHSQNVHRRAVELGLEPLAYCDQMEQQFRDTWRSLDISFDDFIRTTEPRHRAGVIEIARRIHAAGVQGETSPCPHDVRDRPTAARRRGQLGPRSRAPGRRQS